MPELVLYGIRELAEQFLGPLLDIEVDHSDQNSSNIIFTVITSAFIVGGMLGAMMGGLVADKLGRKKGLILSQVMGVLGGITMSISRPTMAWEVLLVGRLVVGLTAGLNTVLVPVYVSEIAPLHLRGALGVFNQLAVTSGIFLGQILGLQWVLGNDAGWPWLLAITLIPASLQLVLLVLGVPNQLFETVLGLDFFRLLSVRRP